MCKRMGDRLPWAIAVAILTNSAHPVDFPQLKAINEKNQRLGVDRETAKPYQVIYQSQV